MERAKTVLIVDDEPDVLNVLGDMVRGFGFKVILRESAESALSFIGKGDAVDLVITDLRMPGMNGLDLLARIKQARPDVPVIVLTAHGSVESYIQTRSNGVFEYINKPVQTKELQRIVHAAMGIPGTGAAPLEA